MIFSSALSRCTAIFILSFILLITASCSGQQQAPAKDFTLNSAFGPVSITDFRGEVVLLFFGYTHCPDVCPATMSNIAGALRQLTAEQAAKVHVLFVSVDPARDTAEHLAKYLAFFHTSFIGLTGTVEMLKRAAGAYGVEFFEQSKQGEEAYEVIHTSHLFLIDGNGKIADIMSHHTEPDDIAIALRQWLNAKP